MKKGFYWIVDQHHSRTENPNWGKPEVAYFDGKVFILPGQYESRTLTLDDDVVILSANPLEPPTFTLDI